MFFSMSLPVELSALFKTMFHEYELSENFKNIRILYFLSFAAGY